MNKIKSSSHQSDKEKCNPEKGCIKFIANGDIFEKHTPEIKVFHIILV
jgi:hypothetical protein